MVYKALHNLAHSLHSPLCILGRRQHREPREDCLWKPQGPPGGGGEGLLESKEKPVRRRKKENLMEGRYLAMLLREATWKIKEVPNEVDDPDKIADRLLKVQTGFFATYNEMQEERDKL